MIQHCARPWPEKMVAGVVTAALVGDVAAMPPPHRLFENNEHDTKSVIHALFNRDLPSIVCPTLPSNLPSSPGWRTENDLLSRIFVDAALQNCSNGSNPIQIEQASFEDISRGLLFALFNEFGKSRKQRWVYTRFPSLFPTSPE